MLSESKENQGSNEVVIIILKYVQMYIIIIHTICIASLLYNDYAGILEYSLFKCCAKHIKGDQGSNKVVNIHALLGYYVMIKLEFLSILYPYL